MNANAIVIEPPESATASVIWLHGLGADGHDFEPIVPHLPNHLTRHTRFIFPHAPQRPITINGGMVMRGWYDVIPADLIGQLEKQDFSAFKQDAEGIHDSDQILRNYMAEEIERGISAQRIVLAGFSQGGAIALHTGLRYPLTLAGIMALSTYLPLADTVESERHSANQQTPIFMAHGLLDPLIWYYFAQHNYTELKKLGYNIQWHSYNIPHSVSPEEIVDIGNWLSALLA